MYIYMYVCMYTHTHRTWWASRASLFDVLVTVLALISLVTLFFPPSLAEVVEEVCDFMSRHKIRLYV